LFKILFLNQTENVTCFGKTSLIALIQISKYLVALELQSLPVKTAACKFDYVLRILHFSANSF